MGRPGQQGRGHPEQRDQAGGSRITGVSTSALLANTPCRAAAAPSIRSTAGRDLAWSAEPSSSASAPRVTIPGRPVTTSLGSGHPAAKAMLTAGS